MKKAIYTLAVSALSTVALQAVAADIQGFKSATFGSTEAVVLRSLQTDFDVKATDVVTTSDAVTGVRKLEVKLPKLEPIEEPATLTYLIGYKCKCLVQTNISWSIPEKSSKDRREGAMAAMASLLDHFKKKDWKPSEVIEGRVAGELKEGVATNYIFFRGTNDRNSSVTLWGAPVTILKAKAPAKGESELTADVDTINQIVVSYELDYKTPDIKRFNTTGY